MSRTENILYDHNAKQTETTTSGNTLLNYKLMSQVF